MKKSSELKAEARKTLSGRYGTAVGSVLILAIMLIAFVIVLEITLLSVIGLPSVSGYGYQSPYYFHNRFLTGGLGLAAFFLIYIVGCFLIYIFIAGQLRLFMNMSAGKAYEIGDLLYGFRHPFKIIGLLLIRCLIGILTSLPLELLSTAAERTGYIPLMSVLTMLIGIITLVFSIWLALTFALSYMILMEDPKKGVFRCLRESHRMMKGHKWRLLYLNVSFIGMWLLAALSLFIGYLWVEPYVVCTYVQFYYDIKAAGAPDDAPGGMRSPATVQQKPSMRIEYTKENE